MRRTVLENFFHWYRQLPMRIKALMLIMLGTAVILVAPAALRQYQVSALHHADLYFLTPQNAMKPGELFPVEVRIRTDGTPINAVTAAVSYDPAKLEVVNMTTEKSFCTFYLDNSFDNIKGSVLVSCGLPSPGFQGDSIVARLNVRAKVAGDVSMKLDPDKSQALANDGKGSNILNSPNLLKLDVRPLL